jgi:hypothetical protein
LIPLGPRSIRGLFWEGGMRKIALVTAVIVSVTLFLGDCGSAPTIPREQEKERIASASASELNSLVKTVASQVLHTPEVRDQLIREALKSLSPEDLKDIVTAVAKEMAKEPELRSLLLQMTTSGRQPVALASLGHSYGKQGSNRFHTELPAGVAEGAVSNSTAAGPANKENRRTFTGDPIFIITHPSNSIPELTTDQVRRLVSGEYANWNQVGGLDLPVKVIVWSGSATQVEEALDLRLAGSAARVKFLSLIIPSVNLTEGALGLLPTRNIEQLEFVVGHEAVRKVAISKNDDSPAVTPSKQSLSEGSYPVMTKPVALITLRSGPAD